MKTGDVVRSIESGTLFEVIALPSPEMPLLTVRFRDAPDQIRCVDPTKYVVVKMPKTRTRKREIRDERQRKQLDHDRQQRGGYDREL